jgi:N-acetylglucosaminyldiphosphoundecaprenol N-acetyl-beta-D-mannosaminyltransferase
MKNKFSKIFTMGLSVFDSDLSVIELENSKALLLNTISPNSYGISIKDKFFRESLQKCDFLVLDGVYFALSSILLQGKNIKKNQGPDVFSHFIERINKNSGKVFFLGATPKTLDKIIDRAKREYPNLSVGVYSPPFKTEFSEEDNKEMIEYINNFEPDVLFVGMTCPKQEKWAYQNMNKLNTKLICCVGAVFDWYAGNQKEIHPLWWKLRLAWLKRTIDRPEILKRYPNIGLFFFHLFLALIGIKKYKYGRF